MATTGSADAAAAMWSAHQVATRLGVSVDTMRRWAKIEFGPRPIRVGRRAIRYRPDDVNAWIRAREAPAVSQGSDLDPATEAYIARLLAEAPPLSPEQAALVVRTFGPGSQRAAPAPGKAQTGPDPDIERTAG